MVQKMVLSDVGEASEPDEEEDEALELTSMKSVVADLKMGGLAVLLHIGVGRVEPGTITLHDTTGKLTVRTDRMGWWGLFHCCCLRHEFGPGELEPVPRRVYTSRLHRSIAVLSGGDPELKEDLLERSLSLIRRFPTPDSVNLTFPTADAEERLRKFVNERLTVKAPQASFRRSSRHVTVAMQGRCPDSEDVEPGEGLYGDSGGLGTGDDEDDEGEDVAARLLKQSTSTPSTTKRRSPSRDQSRSAPAVRGGRITGAGGRRRKDRGGGSSRGESSSGVSSDAGGGADDEASDLNVSGQAPGGRPAPTVSGLSRRRHGNTSGGGGGAQAEEVVSDEDEQLSSVADEEMTATPESASAEKPSRRNTGRTRRPSLQR